MDKGLREATKEKYQQLVGRLTENTLRLWAATEAMSWDAAASPWWPVRPVCRVPPFMPVSKNSNSPWAKSVLGWAPRVSGSPAWGWSQAPDRAAAELLAELERLVDPLTRGDPRSPLRWTCKSTPRLAAELRSGGYQVSQRTVCALLGSLGYSLQSVRKSREGAQHPDRDAQFQHIARQVAEFLRAGQPVISVDTKKKELVGDFTRSGQEWQPKGRPEAVRVHASRIQSWAR